MAVGQILDNLKLPGGTSGLRTCNETCIQVAVALDHYRSCKIGLLLGRESDYAVLGAAPNAQDIPNHVLPDVCTSATSTVPNEV